jgi:hypothetical protein
MERGDLSESKTERFWESVAATWVIFLGLFCATLFVSIAYGLPITSPRSPVPPLAAEYLDYAGGSAVLCVVLMLALLFRKIHVENAKPLTEEEKEEMGLE